ncbi:DUF1542 domain-containing protein, partial [Streptococcus sp. NLN64]|uniref:YSIRK-type signal peptide-containing protein n=1 Tax=Streptococcus sp. NLN64 TaxID=2822799 RepID=UPI0018C8D744
MFKKKQRFSIRKFKVGVFSVLVGSLFVLDPSSTVAAEEHSPIDVQVVEERVQPGSGEIASETELPQAEPVEVSPTPAQSAELASETKVTPETAATVVKEDSAPSISEEPAAEEKVTTEAKPVAQAPETAETTTNKETPQVEAQATTKEVETPAEKVESKPATTTGSQFRSAFRAFRNADTSSGGLQTEKVANLDDIDYGVYGFSPTVNKNSIVEGYNGFVHRPGKNFKDRFPVSVNDAIMNKDPKTITDKPYVIIKNVGEYQGKTLDMKVEYVDWKKSVNANGDPVWGTYANAQLIIQRIVTGNGLSASLEGLDYLTVRETYIDSATGETVTVKANKALLDLDRDEMFAISNNSNATIQKMSDEITTADSGLPIGTVVKNSTRNAPKYLRDKETKQPIFDTDHRINVKYESSEDKPFEYSFVAPAFRNSTNGLGRNGIANAPAKRTQPDDSQRLEKFYGSRFSTRPLRKVTQFNGAGYRNRYVWGTIINEDVEPDTPLQYVADDDQGHTADLKEDGQVVKDENNKNVKQDAVEEVHIEKGTEEVSFRNETSTAFKINGEPLTQLVFTQKLDDRLTFKNGSLVVTLGEDDNGNPRIVTGQGTTKYDRATNTVTWTANSALLRNEESQGQSLTVDFKATSKVTGDGVIINPGATFDIDKYSVESNKTKITYGNYVPPVTDELQEEVDKEKEVTESTNYTNADPELKQAYDDALTKGTEVLEDPNATQADVDAAKEALEAARNALNGDSKQTPEAVDKSELEVEAAKEDEVTASDAYTKATEEAKKAYDDALAAAKEVLADPAATAEQVAAAKEALAKAAEDLANNPSKDPVAEAKEDAKKAIEEALAEKEAAIDASDATDEEKAAAKEAAKAEADKAKEAVDAAETADAVTEAKDSGVKSVEDVEVPS